MYIVTNKSQNFFLYKYFYTRAFRGNARKHAILATFISVFFWNIKFWWVVCLNMCSYAHNASMKMTLRIMAVNTLTFTPTKFFNGYQNISWIST